MKLSFALLAMMRLDGIFGDRLDNLSKNYDEQKLEE